MSEDQMPESVTLGNKVPAIRQFQDIVEQELRRWDVRSVDGLCDNQIRTVIGNLAPNYTEGSKLPDVDTFRELVSRFQQRYERVAFSDLSESELSELIMEIAPLFHDSEKHSQEEGAAGDSGTDELDSHPF